MDRLRAMAQDSKLADHYAPEKHVVDTLPRTLESIRERAKNLRGLLSRASLPPS